MSEPITWRSISAPNFGASAALLNSGSDTMNQGFTSLANLANGIADKQKGIEVSNAVAALGKATNDSERGAIFDAHAANLRDHGIDLKDLIAANQAQHTTLQGDAAFKSDQELNASNLAGNVLTQAGLGIENKTKQGALDNQVLVQDDAHNSALQNILESNSSIRSNDASVNSSNASAANSNSAIKERLDAKTEKAATEAGMAMLYKELNNPENFIKDANGTPIGVDKKLALNKTLASGVSMSNLIKGDAAYGLLTDEAAKAEAAKTASANLETRKVEEFKQNLNDASQLVKDSKVSQKAAVAAGSHWYSPASYDAGNAAAVDAAHAAQVSMPDGKIIRLDPAEISALMSDNSRTAIYGDNSGGELQTDMFLKAVKAAVSAKADAETNLKAAAKSK